ncbi:hypothetical protein EV2_046453 [Malus domestica]
MYVKCGVLEYAGKVFYGMPETDMVSWNTMNGEYWKSVEVYVKMVSVGVEFDCTTTAVVLKVCSVMEEIGLGIQIHCFLVKMGFDIDVVTGSALVDMFGKCKQLDSALKPFREFPEKNWVSWSAVIAGSVQNDQFVKGIELFNEMQKAGVGVSQSTYASVFRSCAGLSAYRMSDARKIFDLMSNRSSQSYNAIISGLGFDEITLSGALSTCEGIKGHLEGLQLQVVVV